MFGLFANTNPPTPLNKRSSTSPEFDRLNQYMEKLNAMNETHGNYLDGTIPYREANEEIVNTSELEGNTMRVPKKLGAYRVDKIIGKGGFSSVFRVIKEGTEDLRAAKVLPKEKCNDDFVTNEIKILNILDHHNIIKYYESFSVISDERKEYFVIILEYCEGGSLLDYTVDTYKNYSYPKTIKKILYKLVKTIEYLHDKEISHGDLKSENIMLDKDLDPKLIDFGFAKTCKIYGNVKQICTTAYAAPEILKKIPYNVFQADIWALGITFYTVRTGYFPYNEYEPYENQILEGKIEIDINDDLGNLIRRCLNMIPEKRPTIKEILQDAYFQNL